LDLIGWSFDVDEMYSLGYEQAALADRLTEHNITDCKYDVSFLEDMPQLDWLNIYSIKFNLSYLAGLTKLKVLVITNNTGESTDLSYLENLNNLQFLGLYFMSNISNTEALQQLPNLKYLNYRDINVDSKIIGKLNVRTDVGYVDINGHPEKYLQ
jgi:hypothetical protein